MGKMKELKKVCEDFIKNRDTLKETFRFQNSYLIPVCASYLTGKDQIVETEQLKKCSALMKKGLPKAFGGNAKLPVLSILAADHNPEEKLERIQEIYQALKLHFHSSEYLALVAAIMDGLAAPAQYGQKAKRGKDIYHKMKKEHPFLTSKEDSVFAVLLAFSSRGDEELIADMETCYQSLKGEFSSGNYLQSLSQVLAFSDDASHAKCKRFSALYQTLKNVGLKYGRQYELAVLGALSVMPVDIGILADEIREVDAYLQTQKGYGIIGLNRKIRLMHAAMLVSGQHQKNQEIHADAAVMTGTLALLAAQQAAMCAVMASCVAATAANSGSSN